MRNITFMALSICSIQICSAQSAIFNLFESNNSNTNQVESQITPTPTQDLTDQIVDSYTLQNSTKSYKSTTPNSKTQSLEQMLKIQQQQTADLISAAQAATKAASQASIAANNLALKIQLLIRSQESSQQILQKKLNSPQ
ncbi:MAG: hypothetical protein K2Y14_09720 [Burkholderiales bacterium]|nr:hypothetical protein [Burkholderiales bacterium]